MLRHTLSSERGFALAAVILALIALTGVATAGYLRADTDYRINANHRAALHAFNVADAARSSFMGRGRVRTDTVGYSYQHGDADVWLSPLLMVDDSSRLYRLNTRAEHTSPNGLFAERRLVSVVLHKAAGFSVNAAITASNGLLKNGTSGGVVGFDGAAPGTCSVAGTEDVAGLAVPQGGFSQSGGGKGKGGGGGGFTGNPGIDSTSTAMQLLLDTGIDWQGLLDGSYAEADFIVSQHGYPDFTTDVGPTEWPVILADYSGYGVGNNESGRGALIVQGDLTIGGNFNWDGLILVGGELTSNGIEHVDGAVITGLNMLLGGSPGVTDLGNGNWDYQYNSCNVLNALRALGWPVEEPGTWAEVF